MTDIPATALADLQALMQTAQPDPWLTPEEAADLIGRTPATLKRWRRTGRGPPFFRYGSSGVRYRLSAVTGQPVGQAQGGT
jgi:hypothetical protein